jgi:hypothetical protein
VTIGPETTVTARVAADAGVTDGQRVHLRVDPTAVHVFDESGDRVAMGGER